jgi:hypothetical protein
MVHIYKSYMGYIEYIETWRYIGYVEYILIEHI